MRKSKLALLVGASSPHGGQRARKPEITNFRIKWDKVADLALQTFVFIFTLWFMVFGTIAILHNL